VETRAQLRDAVFKVSGASFEQTAIRVFQYQYQNNSVYHEFCDLLRIDASLIQSIESIPFLLQ
jgi:hypothetical protein